MLPYEGEDDRCKIPLKGHSLHKAFVKRVGLVDECIQRQFDPGGVITLFRVIKARKLSLLLWT